MSHRNCGEIRSRAGDGLEKAPISGSDGEPTGWRARTGLMECPVRLFQVVLGGQASAPPTWIVPPNCWGLLSQRRLHPDDVDTVSVHQLTAMIGGGQQQGDAADCQGHHQ